MRSCCTVALQSGVLCLLFGTTLTAQAPDTVWTRTYGGTNFEWGKSVVETHDGGYLIVGGTCLLGGDSSDVYVVKTDVNGDTVWTRRYGEPDGSEFGQSGIETSDSGYVVVGLRAPASGDTGLFIMKIDTDGDTAWTAGTYIGWEFSDFMQIEETSDGGYIIVGLTTITGDPDACMMKTDEYGDSLWTRRFGGSRSDGFHSVRQTFEGGYIAVGYVTPPGPIHPPYDVYLVRTDASGDSLWSRTYGGDRQDVAYSVDQTEDSGFVIAGYTSSFDVPMEDVYLIRTDKNGDTLWARTYGGPGFDQAYSVKQVSDGGYIVAGFGGSLADPWDLDLHLMKTDSVGDTEWMLRCGGVERDGGFSVQQTVDGGYVAAGWTESFGAGNQDVYLIKTAPEVSVQERVLHQERFFNFHTDPNPCAGRASIRYTLPQTYAVRIAIYNLLGHEICALVDHAQPAGHHTIIWNGSDDSERRVPSGIYFLRLQAGKYAATRKLVVVR